MFRILLALVVLAHLPMVAFSQEIGTSAKDLISARGVPESFSAEYGDPQNPNQTEEMQAQILSPGTPGWKKQLLLAMYGMTMLYNPVFDYGTEQYVLRENVVYKMTFTNASKSVLPFSLKFGENLTSILRKVPAAPSEQSDPEMTSDNPGKKVHMVSFKAIQVGKNTCDVDLWTYDDSLSEIKITRSK